MGNDLQNLARLIRYYILTSTTAAGSGHATSSLSAVELVTTLFFKYFRYDSGNPNNLANDRFILSKGHASPLLYSLYAAAGAISEKELLSLRKFDSELEGHPTPRFRFAEAATGSLGQGLSIGVGMCLALRQQQLTGPAARQPHIHPQGETPAVGLPGSRHPQLPNVYVLLGDGEMAEGQVWEAINLASHYKLNNLVAILDVNRLGQSQQTMLGHDVVAYAKRVEAFGWRTIVVEDGHNLEEVDEAFLSALDKEITSAGPAASVSPQNQPTKGHPAFGAPRLASPALLNEIPVMIIAKTIKGKGVSFLEDKNGWHGRPLSETELESALKELGPIDKQVKGVIQKPESGISNFQFLIFNKNHNFQFSNFKKREEVATRKAFGNALVKLGEIDESVVVLDGDVQNSTYTEAFARKFPERFFQMYIAEQNLVSTALGMARLGYKPVVSTFGAFLTRAYDQIRMAALSGANILFNGSHAGVSIGEDGPSQMGLEDLAMFRSLLNTTVLYPADAVAAEKLLAGAYAKKGIVYLRTARPKTPVIYGEEEEFPIGGSKVHYCSSERSGSRSLLYESSRLSASGRTSSNNKIVTIVVAGITLIEALKAQKKLVEEGIGVDVIDCYCLKPIDKETLVRAAKETGFIITVEDHYPVGGLGDAVLEALAEAKNVKVIKLAVTKTPCSGKPEELLDYEGISAKSIVSKTREIIL